MRPAWASRVAERLVVLGKPGNAGGGKGPQFERNAGKEARTLETGANLAACGYGSETPDGVACESEWRPGLPVLHAEREGLAAGRAGSGLAGGAPERRGLRRGRRDGRGCRGAWRGAVAGELAPELREDSFRPRTVRQVLIAKKQPGPFRPLGIACQRDWVAQTVAMPVLSPIFEANLQPEQYAYRAGRNALDAVQRVQRLVNKGHREIVDGDLSNYLRETPHAELLRSVARRVSDGGLLGWIKRWLEMAVVEDDGKGGQRCRNRARRERKGTPQGAPISPLLSNVYMRRFILGWKTLGHARRFGAEIVNYADDFAICGQAPAAAMRAVVERMVERLRLPLNATKTRRLRVPEEPLESLGYRVGRNYRKDTGRKYRHAPERGERPQHLPQDQCADGSAVRAAARAGGGGTPEPSTARVGELLLPGPGRSGLRGARRAGDESAAPVAVPEAQGEVREIGALPGREAVGELRPGTPEGAEAQLRVSEGMISNESQVREICTLGSMSGER